MPVLERVTHARDQMDVTTVARQYADACDTPSDIHAHVATLSRYAAMCTSVHEMGVRSGVSTWGFLHGLVQHALAHPGVSHALHGLDLSAAPPHYATLAAHGVSSVPNLTCTFQQGDALHVTPHRADILFIDTLHVFGQLRRELARHAPSTRRFIIMHDTTVDAVEGEAIRCHFDVAKLAATSGLSASELRVGLWPAVTEFLEHNATTWRLCERFTHNNGLTVLERTAAEPRLRPISFSMDDSRFRKPGYVKDQAFSSIVPGARYAFTDEAAYYDEYARSYFAITTKKAGWDCLRHYEIIASGCVPYFVNLQSCPATTMTTLPKAHILSAMHLPGVHVSGDRVTIDFAVFPVQRYYALRDAIWHHTKLHCCMRASARRVLHAVAPFALESDKAVLWLGSDARPDYLRCTTLAGFMQLLGPARVVDAVHVPHVYSTFPAAELQKLYGNGFSYTRAVAITHEEELQKAAARDPDVIERNIAARAYCLIVYGSVHRGLPHLESVRTHYAPSEVIALCGEDDADTACVQPYATCFKRELAQAVDDDVL